MAHVRVRRIERIRFKTEWLEREAAADLAALRFIASSPEISRELWVYSPKSAFQFLPGARKFARGARPVREPAAGPATGPGTNDAGGHTGLGGKIRGTGIRAGLTGICCESTGIPPPCRHHGIRRSTDGHRRRKYLS